MIDKTTEWLLSTQPWVEYRTRLDLLGQSTADTQVLAAWKSARLQPPVQSLVKELAGWDGAVLQRHNDASHLLHKLTFLADLGFQAGDEEIKPVVQRVMEHHSAEGPFQVLVNVPAAFGGSGTDQWAWMLCDAPLMVYALAKLGLQGEQSVQKALGYLTSLIQENGWRCRVAPELGRFRGPGRKEDFCPYATLVMLKALAQVSEPDSDAVKTGAEALLTMWTQRKEKKYYLFGMGTDFAKLKAPLVWFDIVHVLDVLSQFTWLRKDPRLQEMAALVQAKADAEGRYTAESMWMAWKGWDFGQKKMPSAWITFLVRRILCRVGLAGNEQV